jgi:hypothetical protein
VKKPNFFIIGAPKCGTTSLASWLTEHPQIFTSVPKEPMFFNTDFGGRDICNLTDYEALFAGANEQNIAVGEASTFYLCSRTAVPSILEYSPDARFIVLLRKPQEMIVSLHAQVCKGLENQHDFAVAWKMQSDRLEGRNPPPFSKWPELYQYGERCRVGSQLERLLTHVPRERVSVHFLEDIKDSPESEFNKTLSFLDVDSFRPKEFLVKNVRVSTKYLSLKRALNFLGYLKSLTGVQFSTGLLRPVYKINQKKQIGNKLSLELTSELDNFFADEIALVEKIVGRVPDIWKA